MWSFIWRRNCLNEIIITQFWILPSDPSYFGAMLCIRILTKVKSYSDKRNVIKLILKPCNSRSKDNKLRCKDEKNKKKWECYSQSVVRSIPFNITSHMVHMMLSSYLCLSRKLVQKVLTEGSCPYSSFNLKHFWMFYSAKSLRGIWIIFWLLFLQNKKCIFQL